MASCPRPNPDPTWKVGDPSRGFVPPGAAKNRSKAGHELLNPDLTLTRMEKAGHERGVPCFGQRAKPFGRGPGANPNQTQPQPGPTAEGTPPPMPRGVPAASVRALRFPATRLPSSPLHPRGRMPLLCLSPGEAGLGLASEPDRLHPEERRSVALRIQSEDATCGGLCAPWEASWGTSRLHI